MKKIFLFLGIFLLISILSYAADIIEEWDWVVPPQTPSLQKFVVDNETALLILDIEELTCNKERRPRCLDTVPIISNLLKKARDNNIFVAYSLTPNGKPDTILKEVSPLGTEPVVNSTVNKFLNTNLDNILKAKGIKKLIITGTAANGAVLFTATEASQRGYKIIVPVDCLSADLFAEQAVVHTLINGPGTRNNIILTRSTLIEYKQ
ncbi:MAG: cysteine hydrolase [Calditerrivibrio sp.]|nr:cysteine hydrolase [Calditerrivibrio sp.]